MTFSDPDTGGAGTELIAGYAPPEGVWDEMLGANRVLRPAWAEFIAYLGAQTQADLTRRFARGDQYLHDAGVLYRQYDSDTGSAERNWPLSHIPVLIDAEEWQTLAQGLIERADLLERVMADLYGPGRLVSDGHLPASLVAEAPEWMRPMVGVQPTSGHFLHLLAFEIGRSPDGSWLVMGDRTQAPSGAGFALENRVATSKVFADHYSRANVERLAGFFRDFRDAMTGGGDRAAILTPGPMTETYFEHAYVARYLGLPLLEGEDLQIAPEGVMVRTVAGPEPVRALWRRLDSRFADPLELDETSAIGAPGLMGAIRAGQVSMINAIGSGVLENRAFMAFLPRIAQALNGQPLSLPNIATWWCGQPAERAYVREKRADMMLGLAHSSRLPFERDGPTFAGQGVREGAGEAFEQLLEREGAHLVGQETVRLSTTPAMVEGRLQPRPMILRVFAARGPQGWRIMPGGYARIGRVEDPTALAMQRGGSVSDVWVRRPEQVAPESLAAPETGLILRSNLTALPARTADNLFWLGRYVERAEGRIRIIRAYHQRLDMADGRALPVLDRVHTMLTPYGVDTANPIASGLVPVFENARGCAGKVRDRFSTDGWRALNEVSKTAAGMASTLRPGDETAVGLSSLLRQLAGLTGLLHENMFHDTGWRFLNFGRALERADQLCTVLAEFTEPDAPQGSYDLALDFCDSTISFRRRYALETRREAVIDMLALDPQNPRGLTYQIETMRRIDDRLPRARTGRRLSDPGRRLLTLSTELSVIAPQDLPTRPFDEIGQEIRNISDALSALYFG